MRMYLGLSKRSKRSRSRSTSIKSWSRRVLLLLQVNHHDTSFPPRGLPSPTTLACTPRLWCRQLLWIKKTWRLSVRSGTWGRRTLVSGTQSGAHQFTATQPCSRGGSNGILSLSLVLLYVNDFCLRFCTSLHSLLQILILMIF